LLRIAIDHAVQFRPAGVVVTAPSADLKEVVGREDFRSLPVEWVPSASTCGNATERVVQIFDRFDAERFLSIPIDEPALNPREISHALEGPILGPDVAGTFWCDFFEPADWQSPLSAKVVVGPGERLLYLSRTPIPVMKDGSVPPDALRKNVGAFAFGRGFLERLRNAVLIPSQLDKLEGLEQLRWIELGLDVRCFKVQHIGFGIDTEEQIRALERRLECWQAQGNFG
jgi:CMP-2-keto-3-deoxyoctulosonic acid synthetase